MSYANLNTSTRDYGKELDELTQQISNLQSENSRLIKEMNKLYKMYDDLHTTVEFLIEFLKIGVGHNQRRNIWTIKPD